MTQVTKKIYFNPEDAYLEQEIEFGGIPFYDEEGSFFSEEEEVYPIRDNDYIDEMNEWYSTKDDEVWDEDAELELKDALL